MAFLRLFKTVLLDFNRMCILTEDCPTVWQQLNLAWDELEKSLLEGNL